MDHFENQGYPSSSEYLLYSASYPAAGPTVAPTMHSMPPLTESTQQHLYYGANLDPLFSSVSTLYGDSPYHSYSTNPRGYGLNAEDELACGLTVDNTSSQHACETSHSPSQNFAPRWTGPTLPCQPVSNSWQQQQQWQGEIAPTHCFDPYSEGNGAAIETVQPAAVAHVQKRGTTVSELHSPSDYAPSPKLAAHDAQSAGWQHEQLEVAGESSGTSSDAETDELNGTAYSQLLEQALKQAPNRTLTLQEVYDWFRRNTKKARDRSWRGWENSVRHNLSQNKGFERVTINECDGSKSNAWRLTAKAAIEGVKPTTHFRKRPARKPARHQAPAIERQISGAKGGKAARAAMRRRQGQARKLSQWDEIQIQQHVPELRAEHNVSPQLSGASADVSPRAVFLPPVQVAGSNQSSTTPELETGSPIRSGLISRSERSDELPAGGPILNQPTGFSVNMPSPTSADMDDVAQWEDMGADWAAIWSFNENVALELAGNGSTLFHHE